MPFALARLSLLARISVEFLVKCLSLLGADDADLVIFTAKCSPRVDDRVDMQFGS
jgi:hypothetical protein